MKCSKQVRLTRLSAGRYIYDVGGCTIVIYHHGDQWLGYEAHAGMTRWHWPTLAAARDELSWMEWTEDYYAKQVE